MNKVIIICGSDQLGKGTLIKGICEYYKYHNVTIRHCDKPPKNLSNKETIDFQWNCFNEEAKLISYIFSNDTLKSYHDNIIIFDRFYLGEFVYSTMFRGGNKDFLANQVKLFEDYKFKKIDIHLILLTGNPAFCLKQEDGNSFSQNMENKIKEIELFDEVFNVTTIKNKLKLWVHAIDNLEFFDKEILLNTVIKFIEQ